MPTRVIDLTPELDSIITSRLDFDLYKDANEVISAALRLLKQEEHEFEEKLAVLRAEIQKGLDSGIAEDGVFERIFAHIHEVATEKSENVA
jgi:antitoxin ParD1/3/4